jgi:hypothetical protein
MKLRNGFVSNSSTSSFLIFGVCIEGNYETSEKIDEIITKLNLGLEVHAPGDYDSVYIGQSWDEVGDDETGLQFKDRVTAELVKLNEELAKNIPSESEDVSDDEDNDDDDDENYESEDEIINIDVKNVGTFSEAWRDG